MSGHSQAQMPRSDHLDALLVCIDPAPLTEPFRRRYQLGLYYLAQHAVDAGFRVKVETHSSSDPLVDLIGARLDASQCRVLGFYVSRANIWDVRRILPLILAAHPGLDVVVGGPQVTMDPARALELLEGVTCGVIGEGEDAFVELLSLDRLTPLNLRSCRGLALRDPDGRIEFADPRPPRRDLDSLSIPRRRELTAGDETPLFVSSMITGRGCTGRCAFCAEGSHPTPVRFHSAARCIEEFTYLAEACHQPYIIIEDDSFVAHPARLRDFCIAIRDRYRGAVKWFCEARVDTLYRHLDLLPLMIEAGLVRLQVGAESGSQMVLDAYGKGTTLDQLRSVVDQAFAHGLLSVYANFIVGGAFESEETYRETRAFALELLARGPGCVSVGSGFYTPYAGTAMCEFPERFGIEILDKEGVCGYGYGDVSCRTTALSRGRIRELGLDFAVSAINRMRGLASMIPADRVEMVMRAHYDWDLDTEWYEELATSEALAGYYGAILARGAHPYTDLRSNQLCSAYPVRTVALMASRGHQFIVRQGNGAMRELDALESPALELSTGKLSLGEIAQAIAENGEIEVDRAWEALIARFERFDEQRLVVWRV